MLSVDQTLRKGNIPSGTLQVTLPAISLTTLPSYPLVSPPIIIDTYQPTRRQKHQGAISYP